MESEELAQKKAKSVTGTDQSTLFGHSLRQRKCSDEDVGLNRPTTPEDNLFPNRMSAEDESDIVAFIPENFPTVNAEVIDYGNENVSKLADFYNIDRKSARDVWRNFKYEVMINCHSNHN